LVTEHHNWFSEYGTRAPEVKNANAFIHQYNNYLSDYGYNKDGSNNVAYPWLTAGNASGYTPVWTGGMLKNGGVGSYAEAGGHMYVDNNIYRATTGASGNAREGASNFGGSPTPTLYVTGSLLENGAIKDGNSPDSGFTPSTVYSYNPDTANAALKQRLIDEAGQSRYWAAG
jgi:pectate lyase